MKIFKVMFVMSILGVVCNESFANPYRVMGNFTVADKVTSNELKVDLAALSKITDPKELETIQSTKIEDSKTVEQISLNIVFAEDGEQEARDYFEELKKQGVAAEISIHPCTNSEYSGMPNVSCIIEEEVILTKS